MRSVHESLATSDTKPNFACLVRSQFALSHQA